MLSAFVLAMQVFASATLPQLRIGAHYEMGGYSGNPASNQTDQRILKFLDYYKALGYTHVQYNLIGGANSAGSFQKVNGNWVYNGGNYAGGEIYRTYKAFVDEANKRGLVVIPSISCLSHVDRLYQVDPTVWEFSSVASWEAFARTNLVIPETGLPDLSTSLRMVANPVNNPGLTQLFREHLRIIAAVQGRNVPYVHLGFDEPAWGEVLLIKRDRSASFPGTASQLIVKSLEDRISQINVELSSSTKTFIYADGYVPGHQGDVLVGISEDLFGANSVLQLIKKSAIASARTIVMPWAYEMRDNHDRVAGSWRLPQPKLYNKLAQLAYIDGIKLPYVIMMGEGSGEQANIVADPNFEFIERQCTFEWLKASQLYPAQFRGIAHATWSAGSDCNSNSLCVGYQAPIIAYLGWQYSGRVLDWVGNHSYSPEIFNNLNYKKSRANYSWIGGSDFFPSSLLRGGGVM